MNLVKSPRLHTMADRLSDGRQVYLNGGLVTDFTSSPAFSGAINVIESYFRLQVEEPTMHTSADDDGNRYAISLMVPRTLADLRAKRNSYKLVADLSFGMLGRTPDFMSAGVMALGVHGFVLEEGPYASFASNAKRYFDRCCAENLFVGHGAINPQIDRSRSLGSTEHPYAGVRVVGHDSNGIVVSGAKMILTLAAIADELLIFNMPGLVKGDEDFAVAFATPVNAPGLKLVCRKTFSQPSYGTFDHPMANTFDEIDSYLIVEEMFVPWDRVFVFRDVEKSNRFYDRTFMRNHTGHQGIVRGLAKVELAAGLAFELADAIGSTGVGTVQEQLGETVSYLEAFKALIDRSESEANLSEMAVLCPSILPIQATRLLFPRAYERILGVIRSLAPGSMLSSPSNADLTGQLGPSLLEALGTCDNDARRRIKLLNLAWDLVGDAFGQRQLLYEYYHAGEPGRIAIGQYKHYDWVNERAAVARGLSL